MRIGAYERVSPFVTAGSGNARWCVAKKDGREVFLKQFLSPVQPVQRTETPTSQVEMRRQKCASFEARKLRLYGALRRLPDDHIVPVVDFFVHDGHYFAVSPYLGPSYQTLLDFRSASRKTRLKLLLALAECLKALHDAGIVHADIKPEHIIVENNPDAPRVRLIDFDSGFAETSPPEAGSGMEIDPVYLSPEAYRLITKRNVRLNRRLDSFAFAIVAHQLLSGCLPGFDQTKYGYLYAAVLDGGAVSLAADLGKSEKALIRKLLRKHPAFRPGDGRVVRVLKALSR